MSAGKPGIEKAKLGLREVRSTTWMHFVFVNIDGQAEPFEDFIVPNAIVSVLDDHVVTNIYFPMV